MTEKASISMIDDEKCKFVPVGEGTVSVNSERITVTGVINGKQRTVEVPTGAFASLPFVPGERLEVQDGDDIYRCALGDGKQVMKFVNAVKIFYELKNNVKVD